MQVVYIDLIPQKIKPLIKASQFDDKRHVRFRLTENGEDYTLSGTETVTVTIRKPDRNIVVITPTIGANSYIDVYFTEQACACFGLSFGEITIEDETAKIGTCNFELDVELSPAFGGIDSTSEIDNLARQISGIVNNTVNAIAPAIIEEIAPGIIGDEYLTKAQIESSYFNKSEVNLRRPVVKNPQTLVAGETTVTFNCSKDTNFDWRMFSIYASEPNIVYSNITIMESDVYFTMTITFPRTYDHNISISLMSFGLASYTLES